MTPEALAGDLEEVGDSRTEVAEEEDGTEGSSWVTAGTNPLSLSAILSSVSSWVGDKTAVTAWVKGKETEDSIPDSDREESPLDRVRVEGTGGPWPEAFLTTKLSSEDAWSVQATVTLEDDAVKLPDSRREEVELLFRFPVKDPEDIPVEDDAAVNPFVEELFVVNVWARVTLEGLTEAKSGGEAAKPSTGVGAGGRDELGSNFKSNFPSAPIL